MKSLLRRCACLGLLSVCLLFAASRGHSLNPQTSTAPLQPASETALAKMGEAYGKLPLSFEANEGQFDARVKFVSRGGGYSLALTQTEAAFALRGGDGGAPSDLRMKFHNANRNARIEGVDPLLAKSNYLIGGDRSKWR